MVIILPINYFRVISFCENISLKFRFKDFDNKLKNVSIEM